MIKFLKKIKLYKSFEIDIPISVKEVEQKLMKVAAKTTFNPLKSFSSENPEFMGKLLEKGFRLRRFPKAFSKNDLGVEAVGKYFPHEKGTIIRVTINGFDIYLKILTGFLFIFYIGIIYIFFFQDSQDIIKPFTSFDYFYTTFVLIFILSFPVILYLRRRRGVEKLKYDLERELYFLKKNKV